MGGGGGVAGRRTGPYIYVICVCFCYFYFYYAILSKREVLPAFCQESSSSSSRGRKQKLDTGEVFHFDFIEIGTSNYHTFTQAQSS